MKAFDIGEELNAKELPIPTAQRLDVFLCPGLPDAALARWVDQAGASCFHTEDDVSDRPPASFCGIALFILGPWGYLDEKTSQLLQPFYDRARAEANCFQYQPIEHNFVRRDLDWFYARRA